MLVVAPPPRLLEREVAFVPARRSQIEEPVRAHQCLDATGIRGVRVVDHAVLECEGTQTFALRFGFVDVPEIVLGSVRRCSSVKATPKS